MLSEKIVNLLKNNNSKNVTPYDTIYVGFVVFKDEGSSALLFLQKRLLVPVVIMLLEFSPPSPECLSSSFYLLVI